MTWSENKWTVISGIGAVLAVVVPVLIFFLSRDSKELTVKTVSRAVVVDLTEPALASLKLTYKDVSVTRLTAATIDVSNTGSRPIDGADFERELVLRFLGSAPVLAARVAERVPEGLRPELNVGPMSVAIKPLLLNPGDRFRLTVHLRGDFTEPVVDARVSGVSSIQRMVFSDAASKQRIANYLVTGLLALAGYFYLAGYLNPLGKRRVTAVPIGDALVIILILGIAAAVLLFTGVRLLELSRTGFALAIGGFTLLPAPLFFVASRRAKRAATRLQQEHELARPQPPAA